MKYALLLHLFLIGVTTYAQTVSTLVSTNVGDDLHFGADGYLYSSIYGGNHFRKTDPSTGQVDTILTVNDHTIGAIELDEALNIYTCSYDNGWVGRFTEGASSIAPLTTGLFGPAGITHDSSGNLYVATNQNHSIIKIAPDGQKEVYVSGAPLFWPTGITIDSYGTLFVANMFSGQIVKIAPNQQMEVLVTLPAVLDQEPDVAYLTWKNDKLFVCHFGDHVIYQIDPETGDAAIIAGTGTAGNVDGPALEASFEHPVGIAASASGDTLFVTDGEAPNQRLRIIELGTVSQREIVENSTLVAHQLFPDPADDKITLNFSLQKPATLSFQIVDLNGKAHFSSETKVFPEGKSTETFDLSLLSDGTWILVAKSRFFSKSFKFVKG